MSHRTNGRALGLALTLAAFGSGSPAAAHISLEQGGTHLSRYGDDILKDAPCGVAGGGRGTDVYAYQAGETIEVRLKEYIPHPGYFRFAFDEDGDDDFLDPVSIDPVDPNRACPFNPADQCGESDFYNNDAVLPGMDNLDPHVTAMLGQEYTWNVTLPDVACDNCTLQVIQVMEDVIHGGYNTVPGDPNDTPYIADVYHQCIDLVLEKDGTASPTGTGDSGTSAPSSGGRKNSDDGGCAIALGRSTSPASGTGVVAVALGALFLWSRRRRGGRG
jgi:hypothetical protein